MPRYTQVDMEEVYDLTDFTQVKRGPRTDTPPGTLADAIGVDGATQGGLRPAPGFRRVTDLRRGFGTTIGAGGHLLDARGFTLRVDSNKYARGIIYMVANSVKSKVTFRLKVMFNDSGTWLEDTDLGFASGLPNGATGQNYVTGEQFDIVEVGRFLYVFHEGRDPFMFYFTEQTGNPGNFTLNLVTDLGPGEAPELSVANNYWVAASHSNIARSTVHPDMTALVTELKGQTAPATAPAHCKLFAFLFSDLNYVADSLGTSFTNPYLPEKTAQQAPANYGMAARGPSDLGLWAAPPQPDPVFTDPVGDADWNGLNPSGEPHSGSYPSGSSYLGGQIYPYPIRYGELEGRFFQYTGRDIPENEPVPLLPNEDAEVFAYQLYDSRTGRRSQISDRVKISYPEDARNLTDYFEPAGAIRFTVSDPATNTSMNQQLAVYFPALSIVYDSAVYDTVLVWRGRQADGVDDDEIVLQLDSTATLEDYLIDDQAGLTGDWKQAVYFPVTPSNRFLGRDLLSKSRFTEEEAYLEDMPTAGSGLFYDGTMLLGKLATLDNDIGGIANVLFSDLREVSVELVPPENRIPLAIPDEEVIRFSMLGPSVLASTPASQYLIRKESTFLRGWRVLKGMGIASPWGVAVAGPHAYVLAEHALMQVDAGMGVQDVDAVRQLIRRDWAGSLDKVRLAYDETMDVLFMLHPDYERLVCFWMNEGRVTEMADANFAHVTDGSVQYPLNGAGAKGQRRALFIHEVQPTATTKQWRVYVWDYTRAKEKVRMLDYTGSGIFTAINNNLVNDRIQVSEAIPSYIENQYLYVLSGACRGLKARILRQDGSSLLLDAAGADALIAGGGVATNDKLAIGPVYVRAVGHQIPIRNEEGMVFGRGNDKFSSRTVDTMELYLSDVAGTPVGQSYNIWNGLIYDANGANARWTATVYNQAGSEVESLKNGLSGTAAFGRSTDSEAQYAVRGGALFPGFEIWVPDIDYYVHEMVVRGRVEWTGNRRSTQE